jgi:Protein of unknown function (DUF2971)
MPAVRTNPDGSRITLFKYFSPAALEDFVNCRVSLTPPKFFNDRFEFAVSREPPDRQELEAMVEKFERQEYERESQPKISFTAFKQARKDLRDSWITRAMSKEYREAEPAKMRDLLSQLWGVVCLTEVPDNVLMWTNYADSYRGFVAEFLCDWEHTTYVPRFRGTPLGPALKVEYAEKPPVIRADFGNAANCLSTKTVDWSYEQEWRVIEFLIGADFVEQKRGYRFLSFPASSIKRIVCGDRMHATDCTKLLEFVRNGGGSIQLQKTHLNSTNRTIELRNFS